MTSESLLTAWGYGTDPDLRHPTVPWPSTLTPHQLRLAAVLADLILPGMPGSPAPSGLDISDFVDEWVSAPYPEQQSDRALVIDGLAWLDAEARRLWNEGFLDIEPRCREQLVTAMASSQRQTTPATRHEFFCRFRYIVVGAYYTTPEGSRDIGFVGNVPLKSYPPVTDEERVILDAELRKLGIVS